VSAAGTGGGKLARLNRRANLAQSLPIPRTTGMPHRPTSSDGHTSIFVSSNPIGLRYRLSKCARRFAGLSLAIGGFGSAAVPIVSHRRRTVRHGFYRIPKTHGFTLSRKSEHLAIGRVHAGGSCRRKLVPSPNAAKKSAHAGVVVDPRRMT
jgi:hypothetical protein